MPFQNSNSPFNSHAANALLKAIKAPADFAGTAISLPVLTSCLKAASDVWPSEALVQWALVPTAMQSALKSSLPSAAVPLNLFTKPLDPPQLFQKLNEWRAPVGVKGRAYDAHALLGRAIAHCAAKNIVMPIELLAGLRIIKSAQDGKGRRSKDWNRLIKVSLSDSRELIKIRLEVSPTSPTRRFIDSAIDALDSVILPPDLSIRTAGAPAAIQDPLNGLNSVNRSSAPRLQIAHELSQLAKEERKTEPDIAARIAGADYTGFAEKMGLYHRDHMLVDDLAAVTVQLAKFLQSGSTTHQGFALLALVSLVTGCTDEIALNLKFEPLDSIWIDLTRGAWGWDFNVYRQSKSNASDDKQHDPVFCPFPEIVNALLRATWAENPGALTLGDLILAIQQKDEFELKDFRHFLRACGHPSHPPHRGRFARSMPAVYLQTSGSDMTVGLMTGFFASTAPASLFYYGPKYAGLIPRVARVYERLALGPSSHLFSESGRVGCNNLLEPAALQEGWSRQVDAINECRSAASKAAPSTIVDICNRWLTLLCTALITHAGHRGTRIECLTAGALYGHPSMLSIQDKDEGGRAQPRLIPKTATIRQILDSVAECHVILHRIGYDDAKFLTSWDFSDPVFVHWQLGNGILSSTVLSTSDIATITAEFFQAKANFGRSQWVTYLDEYGCDRWLIRSLTGHTRDATRVHGPYLDIPPIVVAKRLGEAMDKAEALMFGKKTIERSLGVAPLLRPTLIKPRQIDMLTSGPVPDPRTLLDPLTAETLAEFHLTEQVRADLLAGNFEASVQALVVLHLVFIDLIPDPELCLDAVIDQQRFAKTIGNCVGLKWTRAHFVHTTWIPIQPTSASLLSGLQGLTLVREKLIAEVCKAIRRKTQVRWPALNSRCWSAITTAACSFRRISLPPSLSAVSHLSVGAPCLSELSLNRLAGISIADAPQLTSRKPVSKKTLSKNNDARFLIATLGKYASSLQRHGEKRARAIKCLYELETQSITWTPIVQWIKDWCLDELRRSRDRLDGCYQISSILTYSTTLLIGHTEFELLADPIDWEDAEWAGWLVNINTQGDNSTPLHIEPKLDEGLSDRTKNAVAALVRSLIRRGEYVPLDIRTQVGLTSRAISPHGSASACLVMSEDQSQALAILKRWDIDFPGDYALTELRSIVSAMVPVRAGDTSSLTDHCLTPSGGLVIERTGYDVHKSQNAIRVIQLQPDQAQLLKEKMEALRSHFGERPLLLRGNGSVDDGLRDHRLSTDWGAALKTATMDASARPHSVRAATLQQIAWPGWVEFSRRIMSRLATPSECQNWVEEQQQDWCRLARAVAMAGQGCLRSALGNYLAGWPLVYSIHASASLVQTVPGTGLLKQLRLSAATLRQARSRSHRRARTELGNPPLVFDSWGWVAHQTTTQLVSEAVQRTLSTLQDKPGSSSASQQANNFGDIPPTTTENEQLVYLTLRMLMLPQEEAIEKSQIRFRAAVQLEPYLPSEGLVIEAVKRGRQGPEPRGVAANINLAQSSRGLMVLAWLLPLDLILFQNLRQALLRHGPQQVPSLETVVFWRRIAESLPSALSIHVRIGSKHLTTTQKIALSTVAPAVLICSDTRLGERPVVSVHPREAENRVLSARLTAVTRTYVLAVDAMRQFKKSERVA